MVFHLPIFGFNAANCVANSFLTHCFAEISALMYSSAKKVAVVVALCVALLYYTTQISVSYPGHDLD